MAFCILVSGPPASGKSTIARKIGETLRLPVVSKDVIKEILFDEIGFSSRAEKVRLGNAATALMYDSARRVLQTGQNVILENNFENASRAGLLRLQEDCGCALLHVRLGGDLRAIYARYVERNESPDRHRGHVVNDRCSETEPGVAVPPLSYADFSRGVRERGMCDFDIGAPLMDVDATRIEQMDAVLLAGRIRKWMEMNG